MSIKPNHQPISDAPESNAGDDFHIKWGVHKSLELINFEAEGLKALTVEGVYYGESRKIDSEGRKLLGVDLGEYFGGTNFNDAKRVVFSQMKYSTRNASDAYTVAKLCENKGKGKENSLISRLASAFQAYHEKFGGQEVTNKLKIKLVTNRQVSAAFLIKIKEIQSYLAKNKRTELDKLKQSLPNASKEIDRLLIASKLSNPLFVDFLKVLDFSDCGTGSRFEQKAQILKLVSEFGDFDIDRHYKDLYHLVLEKAMPEGRMNNKIELPDVLLSVNVGSIDSLLPVPSKFDKIEVEIPRKQTEEILIGIKESQHQLICLHGGAGIGKSTLVNSLSKLWDKNHVSVLFDCYGQGTYMDSSQARHIHSNATLQIVNEIALKLGTHVLLPNNLSSDQYIAELGRRIRRASELLADISPDALLIIIIDAADNSVTAAQEKNDECFIHDLLTILLPSNCRLIVTARTNRIDSLKLPDGKHTSIQIEPFTLDETSKFLKKHFSKVKDNEVLEFHQLTHMTPRVQAYALRGRNNLNDVFKLLRPYGKTVGSLIKEHIEQAKQKLGDKNKIDKLLEAIIALPRPVPTVYIAKVSEIKATEVNDFCMDLWSGLVLHDDFISFRDEDFENYLREKYLISTECNARIADILLAESENDIYAAANLGNALFNADKIERLQDIVIEEALINVIKDPLNRKRTQLKRATLAFKGANLRNDNLTFLKLLFLAAEAQKTNQAQMAILETNIDLVMAYSDLRTIQELYFGITTSVHSGGANFECAAYFAKNENTHQYALEHLRQGKHWIEYLIRNGKKAEKRNHREKIELTEHQISKGAEATLLLLGVSETRKWMRRIDGRKRKLDVFIKLVNNIIKTCNEETIYRWLSEVNRIDVELIVSAKLIDAGVYPRINIESLAERIIAFMRKNKSQEFNELARYVITLCEYMAYNDISNFVKELSDLFIPQPPKYYPSYYSFNEETVLNDVFFRFKCLIFCYFGSNGTIDREEFYTDKLKKANIKKSTSSTWEERDRFVTLYNHLIPIYQLRAKVISKNYNGDLINEISGLLNKAKRDYRFSFRAFDNQAAYHDLILKLSDIIIYTDNKKELINCLDGFIDKDFVKIRLLLVGKVTPYSTHHDVLFSILSGIKKRIEENKLPATDMVSHYLGCSKIAYDAKDYNESKLYFDKAVSASVDIDYDTFEQIRTISHIAYSFSRSQSLPTIANKFSHYVEHCKEVLTGFDHFPADDALIGMESLDFTTAMAAYCRWDHLGTVLDSNSEYSYWFRWLRTSVERKELSAKQAFALSVFHPINTLKLELGDVLIEEFNRNNDVEGKQTFFNDLIQEIGGYVRADSRVNWVSDLMKFFQKHKIYEGESYDRLMKMKELYNLVEEENFKYPKIEHDEININKIVESVDVANSRSIEEVLKQFNERTTYGVLGSVFQKIRGKCSVQNSIRHLNAIMDLSPKVISYTSFFCVLKDALNEWAYKQTIIEWKSQNYEKILEKYLFDFKGDMFYDFDHLRVNTLLEISTLFGKTDKDLANALKRIFPKLIDLLPCTVVYQASKVFRVLLNDIEKASLIDWALERWHEVEIPIENNQNGLKLPAANVVQSYALFLRYNLGHPDKGTRWRVAHAIRRLAHVGDCQILDLLLKDRNNRECTPYQYEGHTFFWVSSKLWLFVILDKLAEENPYIIAKYSQELLEESLQIENGHALIRLFAKSACLKLLKFNDKIYSNEQVEQLNNVLISKFNEVENDSEESRSQELPELKYDFDTLDTLPYWYQPLGSIFGKSAYYVAYLADKYIHDYLGFEGDIHEKEFVHSSKNTSNGHGIMPTTENLRIYYEYHGMFYAANQLVEGYLTKEVDDGQYGTWKDWLKSESLSYSTFWLSDIRAQVPLEDEFYNIRFTNHDKNWVYNINADFFEKILGVSSNDKKEITVWGDIFRKNDSLKEYIDVSSVLVPPSKAYSLLKALQTSKRIDGPLPSEFLNEEDDEEVDLLGFEMTGWINADHDFNHSGLDTSDYLEGDINKLFITPGKLLLATLNLKKSVDNKFTFLAANVHEKVTRFDCWSDISEHSEYGSKGSRLTISKEHLLKFLDAIDKALIIQCEIRRHVERKRYDYDKEEFISTSYFKFFIIYPNGKIQSLHEFH